jgi:DNA-binding transcriptional ArsR family regulator
MFLSENQKKQAQIFKALSHPIRLRIVEQLIDGEKCVNDIKELFDVTQPNISQHLNILKYSGIIDFHQKGNLRCYFLNAPDRIRDVIRDIGLMIK